MKECKVILTGLGGQGVIFLTRLLARSAVIQGFPVLVSETHGMSQRGGSVISHLKIGGTQAPLISRGTADQLFALEPNEAIRTLPLLRTGAIAFVNAEGGLRAEVNESLERLTIQVCNIPASQMALELGSTAIANVVLAGFSAAHAERLFPIETLRAAVEATVPRGLSMNLQALDVGYQAGLQKAAS